MIAAAASAVSCWPAGTDIVMLMARYPANIRRTAIHRGTFPKQPNSKGAALKVSSGHSPGKCFHEAGL